MKQYLALKRFVHFSNIHTDAIRLIALLLCLVLADFSATGQIMPATEGIVYVTSNGNGDGSSWTNATTLASALADNNATEIRVAEGTYIVEPTTVSDRDKSFLINRNIKIYGGFNDPLPAVGAPLPAFGAIGRNGETILSGEIGKENNADDNAYHVVTFQSTADGALLDGFTITGGNADYSTGENGHDDKGGGIYIDADVTLNNVIVEGNKAKIGAGVFIGDAKRPTITNSVIKKNTASEIGGGVYIAAGALGPAVPVLQQIRISENAASQHGDGIYIYNNSSYTDLSIELTNAVIDLNDGEGIYIWNKSFVAKIQITNVTICKNKGYAIARGNLDANPPASLTLQNTVVWGNNNNGDAFKDVTPIADHCRIQGRDIFDPLFVDADNGDYRLQTCSPLVDAGSDDAAEDISTDFEGKPRKRGAHVDIGAYEALSLVPGAGNIIYVNKNATGDGSGSSWTDAANELADALAYAAIPSVTVEEIWVAKGTYNPLYGDDNPCNPEDKGRYNTFSLPAGVKVYGGFAGGETNKDQRHYANNTTILSGDRGTVNEAGDNCYHVVTLKGHNAPTLDNPAVTTLDGFTVTGGNANGEDSDPTSVGGGIFLTTSCDLLANLIVSGNQGKNGAGIGVESSVPVVVNSVISGNKATNNGGGVYTAGSGMNPQLNLVNATICGNYAGNSGGGIYCDQPANPPNIYNSIIWGNAANQVDATNQINTAENFNFNHSLVESTIPSAGNLDGTVLSNTPIFQTLKTANDAPTTAGDYRLNNCSNPNLRDVGVNSITVPIFLTQITLSGNFPLDLAGNNRKIGGGVDLGAYEMLPNTDISVTEIYVKTQASGSADGSSWDDATTLADAIRLAPDVAGTITIHVAAGLYHPLYSDDCASDGRNNTFKLRSNMTLLGGYPADATGTDLSNRGDGQSILSGDIGTPNDPSDNCYHVITLNNGENQKINGFTIRDGNANGDSNNDKGGAILITNNTGVAVANALIINNLGLAACYIQTEEAKRDIHKSTAYFINVTVSDNEKGGIHAVESTVAVRNSIVWNNGSIQNIDIPDINIDNTDPMFVDAANGDYRLKPNSPAIDAGDSISYTNAISPSSPPLMKDLKDLAGNPRLSGTLNIDLGAYEYQKVPLPDALKITEKNQVVECDCQPKDFQFEIKDEYKEALEGKLILKYATGSNTPSSTKPKNYNAYNVFAEVLETSAYLGGSIGKIGTLRVNKANLTADMFEFTLKDSPSDEIVHEVVVDGQPKGVTVAIDPKYDCFDMGEYITKTIMYNGSPTEPRDVGDYEITYTVIVPGILQNESNYNSPANLQLGTFKIIEKPKTTVTGDMLSFTPEECIYNGQQQGVRVSGKAGMGAITIKYNGSIEKPVNAGKYEISVDIAEGDDYAEASDIRLGIFTIKRKPIDKVDFPETDPVVYGTTLADVPLHGGNTDGDFQWTAKAPDPTTLIVEYGSYEMRFIPFDTQNYDYEGILGYDPNKNEIVRHVPVKVTPKTVTLIGVKANDKVFDNTFDATFDLSNAQLEGRIPSDDDDDVSFDASAVTAKFVDKNVGLHDVEISGFKLVGAKASNYMLIPKPEPPTGMVKVKATITPRADAVLSLELVNPPVVYDGSRKHPEVKVQWDTPSGDRITLVKDVDYVVSYDETTGIYVATGGTIKITGKGNFEGSKNHKPFNIERAAAAFVITIADIDFGQTPMPTYSGYTGTDPFHEEPTYSYMLKDAPGTEYNSEHLPHGGVYIVRGVIPQTANFAEAVATAEFEVGNQVVSFRDNVAIKWDNTLMLNVKKLASEKPPIEVASCTWLLNGQPLPDGETLAWSKGPQETDRLEAGTYSFVLTTVGGATIESDEYIYSPTAKTAMKAYPNPLIQGNELTVESDEETGVIELYNAIGKPVMKTKAAGRLTILQPNQPTGIYFLKMNGQTVKIIIQSAR